RITARLPGPHDHFLINRFGMLYDEITASSLVKIDSEGNNVEPSGEPVNRGGFAIPSTIHRARPDIACVIHTHTIAGCAVSMQLAFQQSGAEFNPLSDAVVSAGYARSRAGAVRGHDPNTLDWPALLRKLDRLDPSYKE